jgi:K+-sensing histidine kinase KdpD
MKEKTNFWANPHFWLIVILFALVTVFQYRESLGILGGTDLTFGLSRHVFERILYLLIIFYASFIFGLWPGLITVAAALVAMLPRAIVQSQHPADAMLEVILVTVIGIVLCIYNDRIQKYRQKLEAVQVKLQESNREVKSYMMRLKTLNIVSSALSQSLDPKIVIDTAKDKIATVLATDLILLFKLDEKAKDLRLIAHDGVSSALAEELDHIKVGEGFNGQVAATGEPLIVEDASSDKRLTRLGVQKDKIHPMLIVPMKSKGGVIGTICVGNRHDRKFLPEEVELLGTIAGQMGSALTNAYLYEEAQKK